MQPTTLYEAQISAPGITAPVELRYCQYACKSCEAEEKHALSKDSQTKEMLTVAQRVNLNLVEIYRNAGDLGAVVDLLDQKPSVEIRTHSQRFINNSGRIVNSSK